MKGVGYFSHDSNAQHDPKIIKMRSKLGWESYGLFWALIEKLRNETSFKLEKDYETIAFGLRSDYETVKSIVEDYGLFIVDDEFFCSKRLNKCMELKEEKSEKARQSSLKRWGKNADGMRSHNDRNAIKEKKRKDNKIKDNKKTIKERCIEFENDVREYVSNHPGKYAPKLVDNFISYWSEYSKGDKIMRFEKDRPFGIGNRIGTFKRNDFDGYQKEWENNMRIKKEQEDRKKEYNNPDIEYEDPENIKALMKETVRKMESKKIKHING